MDEHSGGGPGDHPTTDVATPLTVAGAVAILILGAGAAYFLIRAGAEALFMTSSVLISTGLVGLLVMVFLAAVGWFLPRREEGPGRGDDQPLELIPSAPRPNSTRRCPGSSTGPGSLTSRPTARPGHGVGAGRELPDARRSPQAYPPAPCRFTRTGHRAGGGQQRGHRLGRPRGADRGARSRRPPNAEKERKARRAPG